MVKSKVGAKPKKRIKHIFGREEGIHEGVHRDEPGWFRSEYHYYCFGYGYFFHRGEDLARNLTPDYIRDNWNKEEWCGRLKSSCMAIINRERKIAIIKQGIDYSWSIEKALPKDYTIYKTDEDIPIYDITNKKNNKVLITTYLIYLIKKYINTFRDEYKVLNTISKYIPEKSYIRANKGRYAAEIKRIVDENKSIAKAKPLSNKPIYINNVKVPFPSIRTILNGELFTNKEKLIIDKCKFYTKFCLHKGISWKELNKKWSDEYVAEIEAKDKADYDVFLKRVEKAKLLAEENRDAALLKVNNNINEWRKGVKIEEVKYVDYYIDDANRKITAIRHSIGYKFANTQLRIKPGKPNWVETSRGALVPLETAINVFNQLYTNYILSGKTEFEFKVNEFKIGSFYVSRCAYVDKYSDSIKRDNLGYKEWLFTIGCHTLWFDDIKDFARYYNLQDRLSFPLDKTTVECMENCLIHLSSGKTIKAVGTINV